MVAMSVANFFAYLSKSMLDFTEWNIPVLNNTNDNNLLLITKLTIKTYLQSISLTKKKNIQLKHYLQVISFQKLLFISIKKTGSIKNNSFRLKMKLKY